VDVADLPNYTGPGTGSGTLELLSDAGGRFEFVFVSGTLTTARYFTSPDYNQSIEEHPFEQLRYTIEDNGRTTDPQTGQIASQPAVRSVSEATLKIRDNETNDAPVFDFQTVVEILERDDNGETVVPDWATNILPGPSTAIDELERQGV